MRIFVNYFVNYVNRWVKYKTEGKIPQVLSESLSTDTKVVIASVLHFRAMWERTFLEGGTTPLVYFFFDHSDIKSFSIKTRKYYPILVDHFIRMALINHQ